MKTYTGAAAFAALFAFVGLAALPAGARQNPAAINAAAPELEGGPWLNTPKGRPLRLAARRGKVTILHFWTFGCINCQRNLDAYNRWHAQFAKRGVAVIGVHTPETREERQDANVVRHVKELGIAYPVLMDQKGKNWARWAQQFWPTVYLLDKRGRVRYRWEGELEYQNAGGERTLSELVEKLLAEK